jgi:hypothetical protein
MLPFGMMKLLVVAVLMYSPKAHVRIDAVRGKAGARVARDLHAAGCDRAVLGQTADDARDGAAAVGRVGELEREVARRGLRRRSHEHTQDHRRNRPSPDA